MRTSNRPHQKTLRQHLRTEGTAAEAVLWTALSRRRLHGRKFRRQHGVGPYVLDFYCPSERLAIEVDGAAHEDPARRAYDAARTGRLAAQGIRVLRIHNRDVFENLEGVLQTIASHFRAE